VHTVVSIGWAAFWIYWLSAALIHWLKALRGVRVGQVRWKRLLGDTHSTHLVLHRWLSRDDGTPASSRLMPGLAGLVTAMR